MKIVSGGQTGVDRAALDVAMELGFEAGGWCPRGRRAEDGKLAAEYRLRETPSRSYSERTEWNVRDADGTLILHRGPLGGGTRLTREIALRYGRPLLEVDLAGSQNLGKVRRWLQVEGIGVLNVAGPRDSGEPGIQALAQAFLRELLAPEARSARG